MNEVTKLYENAGISNIWVEESCKPERHYNSYEEMINNMMKANGWTLMETQAVAERKCRKEYPPFTAEKQLELIKWLAVKVKGDFDSSIDIAKNTYDYWTMYFGGTRWTAEGFEETLAGLINNLRQSLTEAEKAQIKNILESEVRE